jgi:NADH-quinone oxidoreductase subunit M
MPGSANFIGELYILNGLFQAKIVYAIVASVGVALAAYYALRLYQRAMHNRAPEGVESREISRREGAVLVPLVLCIVGLALYPQLVLKRTDAYSTITVLPSVCEARIDGGYDCPARYDRKGFETLVAGGDEGS